MTGGGPVPTHIAFGTPPTTDRGSMSNTRTNNANGLQWFHHMSNTRTNYSIGQGQVRGARKIKSSLRLRRENSRSLEQRLRWMPQRRSPWVGWGCWPLEVELFLLLAWVGWGCWPLEVELFLLLLAVMLVHTSPSCFESLFS